MLRIGKRMKSYFLQSFFIFTSALLLNHHVVSRVTVEGSSMEPALFDGEQVWMDRIRYQVTEPERFDVVVFQYQFREDQYYMKRIAGLPGETVQILNGSVFINGEKLEEAYGLEPIEDPRIAEEPVILGENEYFVLGDNRNHSTDSRDMDVSNIPIDEITGVVRCRKD